jgi:hypothetical protein
LEEEKCKFDKAIDDRIEDDQKKEEIHRFIAHAQLKEHDGSKQRQIKKFNSCKQLADKLSKNANKNNSIANDCIAKWVKNCSDRILNDPELQVLAKGMNFAITPKKTPVIDIMTATESACRGLPIGEADDLRSKVTTILRNHKPPTPNISKEELKAIDSLRKDKDIKILPADKGKCTVILNTEDYMKKCKVLLNDSKTYEKLSRDPTQKYKKQLVAILRDLKDRGSIDDRTWRKMYPTTETPPNFTACQRSISRRCL